MPSVTVTVLGRIDMERGRLCRARAAMDDAAQWMPAVILDTRAQLATSIESTDGKLTALAKRTRKYGVRSDHLEKLTTLTEATDRLVQEAFALATGAVARSHGLDRGACDEADALIRELAQAIQPTLARPTVPGDAEFLHRAADVIRRRVPDHGVWDLPVMAHEFGHVLVAHLQLYDAIGDQVLSLGAAVIGGWPGYSGRQGEELFCDLFAAFSMGPSYVATMLLHRLDPAAAAAPISRATHPPDASRAVVVLAVLAHLTRKEAAHSRYRTTYRQLESAWTALQQSAPQTARPAADHVEEIRSQVRVSLDFLEQNVKPLLYDWPTAVIRELGRAVEEDRPPGLGWQYRIRDVLNAAWRLRLDATTKKPFPAHAEARVRALITSGVTDSTCRPAGKTST